MTTEPGNKPSNRRSRKRPSRRRKSSRANNDQGNLNQNNKITPESKDAERSQQQNSSTTGETKMTTTVTQVDVGNVAAQSNTKRRNPRGSKLKIAKSETIHPQAKEQPASTNRSNRSKRGGRRGKQKSTTITQKSPENTDKTSVEPVTVTTGSTEQTKTQRSSSRKKGSRKKIDKPARESSSRDKTRSNKKITPTTEHGFNQANFDVRVKRDMVINVSGSDECRIAILQDNRLEELFIERASSQSHIGNIYKGVITNVESSIQAAFIDFGLTKNGFLHISDVQPQYFPNHSGEHEDVGRKIPRHHRPPIQKCFHRGQEVIVQITKEGVGTKGPTLTTYLSIPGRYLVMMPGMSKHGVSRKIEDEDIRRSMRDALDELDLPAGMGFILRTAGSDRSKRDLQRDLNYLSRLWKNVIGRIKTVSTPAELYRESDLVTRTIRDFYTSDFDRILIDDLDSAKKAQELLRLALPRLKPNIQLYTDPEPLFHRMQIESEIEKINMRHVPLASGGSLVIDSTEALVAIDVNSGKFRSPHDAEETAVKINVEAAEEIARQLRLRDLGGLIVCDFIDMRLERNKRKVERALRDALKLHKERAKILRMSAFGLIEMTRQRQGPSIKRNLYFDCPHCRGAGVVKMPESVMLDVMRVAKLAAHRDDVSKVTVTVASDVAFQILNTKRASISAIENETEKQIIITGDPAFTADQIDCVCEDQRGRSITINLAQGSKK